VRETLPSGTPVEVSRPPSGDPVQGLVVIPDIMGLRPLFDDHVARLAAETGWAVSAPEPFAGMEDLDLEDRLTSVGSLDDGRVLGDVTAAADLTGCDTVGVLGFCMGGMYTLKAAGTGRFHRAVSFYGMIHVPEHWASDTQGDPLAAVQRPDSCPVLAIVGTEDPWTPEADVDDLEASGATVVRYDERDHGFVHDPSRPVHHEADAEDAWRRAIEFLSAPDG
jgi:carboxymethylenebutenolidase